MTWLDTITASIYTVPAFYILGGLVIGYAFEKLIFVQLHNFAKKTKWKGDDVVIKATKGIMMIWFGLLGGYLAVRALAFTEQIEDIITKALLIAVVISVTWFVQRLAVGFIKLSMANGKGVLPSTSIFMNLTRLGVWLLGGLVVLQILDQPVTPLLTAMGIGGLAIALGLQETLANLFSGINLIASKKISPGDYVKVSSGEEGFVNDINWRYTTLKEFGDNMVVIPNAQLSKAIFTNYSIPSAEKSVRVKLKVEYNSDLEFVEKTIIDEAKKTIRAIEGAVSDYEPVLRYKEFDDSGIALSIIMRARQFTDQFELKHEFIKRLHKRLKKEGIEIPYPTTTTYNIVKSAKGKPRHLRKRK
ncbi:mechanosensitive ion channel family protein [Patescibacteria group bacterium]